MARERLILVAVIASLGLYANITFAAAPGAMAMFDDLHLNETVEGDVFAIGGNIYLGEQAHVRGHVVAVNGSVETAASTQVDGRTIAISSLATMTLDPDSPMHTPRLQAAVSLLLGGTWLLVTSLIATLFPSRLRHGVWLLPRMGWKILVIGLLAYITLIAGMVAVLGLGPALGVPLAITLVIVFLAGKAIGLTILGSYLGSWMVERWARRPLPYTIPVFIGVAALLALRLLPVAGSPIWTLVSHAAVGTGVLSMGLAPTSDAIGLPEPSGRKV
jgi:hypothetical protein